MLITRCILTPGPIACFNCVQTQSPAVLEKRHRTGGNTALRENKPNQGCVAERAATFKVALRPLNEAQEAGDTAGTPGGIHRHTFAPYLLKAVLKCSPPGGRSVKLMRRRHPGMK